jgi:cellulose synthase/poly-beta-1,6-N-acetylglucosamine synthase-like glycosyltransferase
VYWTFENRLKFWESRIRTTLGATGAVYAIRKKLFRPLPIERAVMDDFLIPMRIIQQGYDILYEPKALAFEEPSNSVLGEFRRKVRIAAANYNGISEFTSLLNPKEGFVAFALWSRKVFRWLVPFCLVVAFVCSVFLAGESAIFQWVLGVEGLLLILGALGFIFDRKNLKLGVGGLPYYFFAVNLALLIGFVNFLLKKQRPTWEVIR